MSFMERNIGVKVYLSIEDADRLKRLADATTAHNDLGAARAVARGIADAVLNEHKRAKERGL